MANQTNKTMEAGRVARLDVRMPMQNRELVEQAAVLEGVSLTQFAESTLVERARVVIDAHEKTFLSQRDAQRFLALLDEDAEPTPALTRAVERYRKSGLGA